MKELEQIILAFLMNILVWGMNILIFLNMLGGYKRRNTDREKSKNKGNIRCVQEEYIDDNDEFVQIEDNMITRKVY